MISRHGLEEGGEDSYSRMEVGPHKPPELLLLLLGSLVLYSVTRFRSVWSPVFGVEVVVLGIVLE